MLGEMIAYKWRKVHKEMLNDLYFFIQNFWVNKIEKNKMGGACSVYGRMESLIRDFGWET